MEACALKIIALAWYLVFVTTFSVLILISRKPVHYHYIEVIHLLVAKVFPFLISPRSFTPFSC